LGDHRVNLKNLQTEKNLVFKRGDNKSPMKILKMTHGPVSVSH